MPIALLSGSLLREKGFSRFVCPGKEGILMKIESSAVQMNSTHSYYSHLEAQSEQVTLRSDEAARLDLSDMTVSMVEKLKEFKEEQAREAKEKEKENQQKYLQEMMKKMQETSKKNFSIPAVSSKEDVMLESLKRLMELIEEMREGRRGHHSLKNEVKSMVNDINQAANAPVNPFKNLIGGGDAVPAPAVAANPGKTGGNAPVFGGTARTFTRITVQSGTYVEAESTTYRAQGYAKTEDGREIGFNVDVQMSRAFCQKYDSYMQETFTVKDPLIFNLKGDASIISDQKFMFDIDSDGKKDEISFAAEGSGFLALDKNKDGKINDGSELFGTKSGDGFKDLAEYDKDGNGWIDENDDVFKDLVIWTKDAEGNDIHLSLKDADVGAIYLGRASTEYSLKNEKFETDAVIRSTGVFLKESGGTGIVRQVDLTV